MRKCRVYKGLQVYILNKNWKLETFSVKSRPKPYVLNVQDNHVSSEEQMVSDIRTIFIILYVYFKVT